MTMGVKINQSNKSNKGEIAVLLHDIRSVHNVGSIFRTANALGASRIYLSGFTPTPVDRFGVARKDFAKVSLGAEKDLEWKYFSDFKDAIADFKRDFSKAVIIAIEQDSKALPYQNVKIKAGQSILFIVGNEVEGVPKSLLRLADVIAVIPQWGTKESLNVSVAFGIASFVIVGNGI